ncbi:MAG: hypothetical protein L0Y44_12130 [Phycisphaerales bacterium]|nr:hypothetical protein [Phycisphaerales bacterium]
MKRGLRHPTLLHRVGSLRSARGLSLVELMLAMTITVMVSGAIAGMLGAVTSGVGTRRDTRAVMILANAAQSRLSAYIAPARCLLAADGANLTLWLTDARESGTVHATEVRWLIVDEAAGTLDVSYVHFPDAWIQAAKDLEDHEFPASTDWNLVLTLYQTSGWIAQQSLIDDLDGAQLDLDQSLPINSRCANYQLQFRTDMGRVPITVASTIRKHVAPLM